MRWKVPKIWDGGDVWILGGGPSLTKLFNIPQSVVESVFNKTTPPNVYSEYMKPIHNKHVIGVNCAFMIGDWIDMNFFGDNNFYLKFRTELSNFSGIKISCHHTAAEQDWIQFLEKDTEHYHGITEDPRKVSWNGNSGAAAISVAAHTGAKRIILVGFDMKLDSTTNTMHWHNAYNRGTIVEEERLMRLPFHRFIKGFPAIAEDAKKRGIEIINANPDSEINEFPKFTLKQLLWDNS